MKTRKIKLIGLFLLLAVYVVGQSVPNTTTFSLQDVIDAVNPSSNDLGECFNDANPAYFNLTYKNQFYADFGNKNNMLMFRDYGPHNGSSVVEPTVVTNAATDITFSSVSLNGNVTSDGGATITARGFLIASNPTLNGAATVNNLGQTGTYTTAYNQYCNGITYYYQAFATNSAGTGYGDVVSFTSSSVSLTAYTFYSATDQTAAIAAANAVYWDKIPTGTVSTKYATGISGTGQIIYTGYSPSCKAISTNTWWAVKGATNTEVYIINVSSGSIVLASTQYTEIQIDYTTSTTWVAPAGINYVYAQCWGGGGTGGPATGTGARAAGGAGGCYAQKIITVTPGLTYTIGVAAEKIASATARNAGNPTSITYSSTVLVRAMGGPGGAVNSTTGGASYNPASTTNCVGDVIYAGGNGGAGTSGGYSGGGGGGAGSTGAGGDASLQTAGTGTSTLGGNGGAGTNVTNTSNNGSIYGGGGSGGIATTTTDRAGGNGAAGYLRIRY